LENLDARISSRENKAEENTQRLVESLGKLGDIRAQISSLTTEIKAIEERVSDEITKRTELEESAESTSISIEESVKKIRELTDSRNSVLEQQRLEKQNNIKLAYKQAGLEEDIKDIIGEYRSAQSKMHLMKEMQKENEGYVASVRKLLQEAQNNSSLGGRFVNVVAKLMTVPEKYETAIDMALGSAVQNVVTRNEEDAKSVIQYLKDNNIGRATFLPMTSVKPRRIADEHMAKIDNMAGVCGVANKLISFDSEFEDIFSSLLGSTVIVEDMDYAVHLAQMTKYSFKIVTLDGDVINPAGTISGGSKKVQAVSLIGREREIQEIEQKLVDLERDKNEKEQALIAVKAEQEVFENKMSAIDENLKELEISLAKEVETQKKSSSELEKIKGQIEEVNNSISRLSENKISLTERMEAFKRYEEDINSDGVDESSVKDPEIYLLKKKRSDVNDELTELKIKKAGTESVLVSIDGDILRLNDTIEKTNKELRYNKVELQRCLTDLSELEAEFSSVVDKKAYDENVAALQETRDKLANFDVTKKELSQKLSKLSELKLILNTELQRASDRKYKEENLLVKIDSDIEIMQERVWEEYGLTYATALEYKVENHDIDSGMQESAKLKRQIQGLGSVNVNAIEMLGDVTARFNDLSSQRDDLLSAENDLTKIIDSLTAEMETKFRTEFDKINTNFQGVFKELFGGGRAELKLADPENPLECGIDIAAEPTGKKLQNITLLSGGERALTAIAILFAILKLKPMPFCVLDEIEAALDDANVERYARYLKRFSNYTQFIVITHRKPTMELADTLYGVTMEERGVSKVVSVQLSEAIKNSAKAN
ncbi:MAG: chromosome segregation protein SMC, partial [Clostridia bacterium]|nr:chromosome segregation protein SMC [Clostridia bacterium]